MAARAARAARAAADTAFVLVPGLNTGGWVWQDVAAALRAAGAEAYPLTLSGMGPDARGAVPEGAGPGGAVQPGAVPGGPARGGAGQGGEGAGGVVLPGAGSGGGESGGPASEGLVPGGAAEGGEGSGGVVVPGGPARGGAGQGGEGSGGVVRSGAGSGGAGSEGAGGGGGLEAHIGDVLRAVEGTGARQVVLVGHCYGVHPVVGAADRAAGRVARVVLLDTPMPLDGDPAAALVPDQALRAGLLRRLADGDDGADAAGGLAPPDAEGWRRRGSFAGLGPEAAESLVRRAVPHPWAALAQPLRLRGSTVPVTGVLCKANGSSLAMVEQALALGGPRFDHLAAPHLSYLEMDAGHWPMLAAPEATAEVLLRAAAGEGTAARRPTAQPAHLRPFLLDPPERPRERTGRVDLHLPDGEGPHPAVVFVHGGPVPQDAEPTPRDWPTFLGYARLAAQLGAVGATVDHRLHDLGDFARAARDVEDAVALVRAHPRVDADRVALWFFSTGGLLSADWLAAPPPWLRCAALTYPLLAPPPGWGVEPRFHPARTVRTAGRLPVVLTRAGRERPEFAATVADFLAAARSAGVRAEVVDVPSARHGFETLDHSPETRAAVGRAARAVLAHLAAPG